MDQEHLKQSALILEEVSRRYAAIDPEAKKFASAIEAVIDDAKAGRIQEPTDGHPGLHRAYFFEGMLQQYRDLESAFARFEIEVTGGETPAVKAALDAIRATKPE
ncbi:hypothetical protein UAJ10_10420 [Nitrospirillum sp. BR 11164]|uniref:hypothetical protein n=1 Tax=Nitrospirillum sp. BR 11164 TaxID=3104324 RepID=UPI002AFEAEF0|nr:hypothetical protein [Nitrospirillum sp. BR 11164]MEA1649432.1 hypothetical protein [Nitrospirillum sp. BR 11164]